MNALNKTRIDMGLTYEALGDLAGYARDVTWKHCHAERIPAEAAFRYSAALGIPLGSFRPDLPAPVYAPTPEARP